MENKTLQELSEELWDKHSEFIDDDIDSLSRFASSDILFRRDFDKLIIELQTAITATPSSDADNTTQTAEQILFVPCDENDPLVCGSYTSMDGQSLCHVKQYCTPDAESVGKASPDAEALEHFNRALQIIDRRKKYADGLDGVKSAIESGLQALAGVQWREGQRYEVKFEDKKTGYPAECEDCGWLGSNEEQEGGCAIADTGDYSDALCPACLSNKVGETDPLHDFSSILEKYKKAISTVKSLTKDLQSVQDRCDQYKMEGEEIASELQASKEQPTTGAKWVKASERLPIIDEDQDGFGLDGDYSPRKFTCRFEDNIINGFNRAALLTAKEMRQVKHAGHWEWLDESPSNATSDAVEFAEWMLDKKVVPDGLGEWIVYKDDNHNHYTSEELYQLFTSKEKQ